MAPPTLFAALNVLQGEVIGQRMQRHRPQEFLKFLRTIDRSTPKDLALHCIVDNYATHKKQEVRAWLEKHPRFPFHFIPTSSSWLNLVERRFRDITDRRIRRGAFQSVAELERAIADYIRHNNQTPKPFVWTKSADRIIQKVNRGKALLETLHYVGFSRLRFLFLAARIWRQAGRVGVSCSDHYQEKHLFQRLMDRLRKVARGPDGFAPVLATPLRA